MASAFLTFLLPVCILILVIAVFLCIGIFVYKDSDAKGMNAPLWLLVSLLIPFLVGFIIYLVARRDYPVTAGAEEVSKTPFIIIGAVIVALIISFIAYYIMWVVQINDTCLTKEYAVIEEDASYTTLQADLAEVPEFAHTDGKSVDWD